MKPIIKVEGLSKQYRIGARQESFVTLRDAIAGAVRAPFNFLRRNGHSANNTIWALKDVSFEVAPGEALGIVGRNGAGKSTLLKILSRITDPTTGQVELYGRVGSLLEVGTGFHPELTGRENIFLNGSMLGINHKEIERKFDQIVEFSGVTKFIDTPVKRYSSGMYVRLAFAVAAHLEPEILVVDEVLAVGDVEFQKKCLGKMGEAAQEGQTVIFVSHNLAAVQRLCRTAILLDGGKIVASGTSAEVVSRYVEDGAQSSLSWTRDSTPDKGAYFQRVYVSGTNGEEVGYVTTSSSLSVTMEFVVKCRSRNLQVSVGLLDENGDQIFGSSPQDSGLSPPIEAGQYSARISLPPEILLPKTYGIRVALWEPGVGGIDIIDALRFVAQETASLCNSTPEGRPGQLAIRCDWTMNRHL
jgi:lipopolysaccharide transport system ATP-binding protein